MKRLHLYQHIINFAMLSLLLSACNAARVEPINTPAATATQAPAATSIPSAIPQPTPTIEPSPIPTLSADEFMARQNSVWQLLWSTDGKTLVAAATSGIYILDMQTNPAGVRLLENETRYSGRLVLDWQGKRLLVGDHVLDVSTGKPRYQLAVKDASNASFSPDGQTLVLGENNSITFWDADTGKFQKSIGEGLGSPNVGLFFNTDGSGLYTIYENGKIRQADVATGKFTETGTLPDVGCCFVISPDMQTMFINFPDHGVGHKELWGVESKKNIITVAHCDSDTSFFAFSADSKYFVTGPCSDAQLWDIQAQKMLHSFPGRIDPEWAAAAFSPDDSKLALSNDIGEVQIWDLTSYQLLQTVNIPKATP